MRNRPSTSAASIKAKLLNLAKARSTAFDTVLLHYFQERFLYRLTQSPHRSSLILKGALLFRVYGVVSTRPTKDIDLLGRGVGPDIEKFSAIIKDIASVHCEDGVIFLVNSISVSQVREDASYEGLRVFIEAKLDSARKKLQIDVGFGDLISQGPQERDYPVLLDQPVPNLLVYSKETAIAEKFEAIIRLGAANSRMKDFYDIVYLAEHEEFEAKVLSAAVVQTFTHRGTQLNQAKLIFSDDFKKHSALNEMWVAFLKRSALDPTIKFSDTVELLQKFLSVCFGSKMLTARWHTARREWVV